MVSIGAGPGHLEGLLQQWRGASSQGSPADASADADADADAPRLRVMSVDLDVLHGDFEAYETVPLYCSDMRRVGRGELFDVRAFAAAAAVPLAQVALLFCFGRRLPWRAYLSAFPEVSMPPPLPEAGVHAGRPHPCCLAAGADRGDYCRRGDGGRALGPSGGRRRGAGGTRVRGAATLQCAGQRPCLEGDVSRTHERRHGMSGGGVFKGRRIKGSRRAERGRRAVCLI